MIWKKWKYISIILCPLCLWNWPTAWGYELPKTIYLVKHGWHTAIIVNGHDAGEHLPTFLSECKSTKYLEISWGDEDFFTADRATLWQGFRAIVFPTSAVLLVNYYSSNPYLIFNIKDLVEIKVDPTGFAQLMQYFNSSFARGTKVKEPVTIKRLSSCGCFYQSTEKYHAFKTCNVWIALALKTSGVAVRPFFSVTAKGLLRQARRATYQKK